MNERIAAERGLFWWHDIDLLPERAFAPNNAVPGALEFSAAGEALLTLDGVLSRSGSILSPAPAAGAIQGILAGSGKYVILEDPTRAGGTWRNNAPSTEKWRSHFTLTAPAPFKAQTERLFSEVQLDCESLEDWFGRGSIFVEISDGGLAARFASPEQEPWHLSIGDAWVHYDLSHPIPGAHHQVEFRQLVGLRIRPATPVDLDGAISLQRKTRQFLSLLSGIETTSSYPRLLSAIDGRWNEVRCLRRVGSSVDYEPYRAWLTFSQIENFGGWLDAWLKGYASCAPGFSLLFASRTTSTIEHRFASLVWGLEALHRGRSAHQPDPALEEKIARILASVGGRDKRWLRGQLKRAAEPSLEKRLADIFGDISLGLSTSSIENFAVRVAKRRNELSHFGGPRDSETYTGFLADIYSLTEALELLYRATLLRLVGAERQHMDMAFRSGPMASHRLRTLVVAGLEMAPA